MGIFDTFKNIVAINQQNTPPPPIKKKVLIVEDDRDLRDIYVDLLLGAGFDVRIAGNGEEGLSVATSYSPDLIILDLLMPVMDGKTMLRKLREMPQFQKTAVIILTNQGDVDTIHETQTYGNASDFLIKSNVTPEIVIQKVKMFTGIA